MVHDIKSQFFRDAADRIESFIYTVKEAFIEGQDLVKRR